VGRDASSYSQVDYHDRMRAPAHLSSAQFVQVEYTYVYTYTFACVA